MTSAQINVSSGTVHAETDSSAPAVSRFPKLTLVDQKYKEYIAPDFDNEITLQQLVSRYRAFACSQMHDFIPVYVACGGKELDGMDYIVARKVLKKLESLNITFVRDEIRSLSDYIEKVFGKTGMADSKAYLDRIQNLF